MTTCLTHEMISTVSSACALGPRLQLETAVTLGAAAASVDALEDPTISLGLLCPINYESSNVLLYVAGADGKAQTTTLITDTWLTQGHVVATALNSLFGPSVVLRKPGVGAPQAPHGPDLDAATERLMELRREHLTPMSLLIHAGIAAGYLSTALELPVPQMTETSFIVNLAWDINQHTSLDVECDGDMEQPYDFTMSSSHLRQLIADDASTPAEIYAQAHKII